MMRAAVLQEDRSLEIASVPLPTLRARSVLVEVLAVQLPPFTAEVVSGKVRQLLLVQVFGGGGVNVALLEAEGMQCRCV